MGFLARVNIVNLSDLLIDCIHELIDNEISRIKQCYKMLPGHVYYVDIEKSYRIIELVRCNRRFVNKEEV